MHHHRIDGGLLQQHDVARECLGEVFGTHGVAAIFNDDGFFVILLHVRQRLGQDTGLIERLMCGASVMKASLAVGRVGRVLSDCRAPRKA